MCPKEGGLTKILRCINHQKRRKNVKKCGLSGSAGQTWEKQVGQRRRGQKIWLLCLSPSDWINTTLSQQSLLIIIFQCMNLNITISVSFTLQDWSHWSHLKAFSTLLWTCGWFPGIKMISKPFSQQNAPKRSKLQTQRVRRTWRPLSSLISTPLGTNCPPTLTVIALKVFQLFSTLVILLERFNCLASLLWTNEL